MKWRDGKNTFSFQGGLLLAVYLRGATGAFSDARIEPSLYILIDGRGSDGFHVVRSGAIVRNAVSGHIGNGGRCATSTTTGSATAPTTPTRRTATSALSPRMSATASPAVAGSKSATFNSPFATFPPPSASPTPTAHFRQFVLKRVRFLLRDLRRVHRVFRAGL